MTEYTPSGGPATHGYVITDSPVASRHVWLDDNTLQVTGSPVKSLRVSTSLLLGTLLAFASVSITRVPRMVRSRLSISMPNILDTEDVKHIVGMLAISVVVLWGAVIVGLALGLVVRMFHIGAGV